MVPHHYTDYKNLEEAITGFCLACRQSGLPVGLDHSMEAIGASTLGFFNDRDSYRMALKALLCTCEEHYPIFDTCFDAFWMKRKHSYSPTQTFRGSSNISRSAKASLVMMGYDPNKGMEEEKEEARSVTGASKIESLKKTDFSLISEIDGKELEDIAEALIRQLNHRLKRKLEVSKKGRVDLRRTIRRNISSGELIELLRKSRKKERYRVILLLDVSGSMDRYSFFLLKFIWSLKNHLRNIESFVFSTKLVRITDILDHKLLDETLWQLSLSANNWSGGTRIGECLQEFNERHSKRILNGKSITIVLSDGLDNGNPGLIASELNKIKMRTSKLIWMNPLKGGNDYQPTAGGMAAALPEIDVFTSAHNLDSLLKLENILSDV